MTASALFDHAKETLLQGGFDLLNDTIKAILVDGDDWGVAVTAATNASPIQVTAASHGLTTGDRVLISGVVGNTAANGVFVVTVVDANDFTLDGSTGNGSYTSGGIVVDLSNDTDLDDIPAGVRVSTSGALTNPAVTDGIFDADDVDFTGVSGDECEFVVLYHDTGTPSTSTLIYVSDDANGLPITPSGSDITVRWDSGANKIFALTNA